MENINKNNMPESDSKTVPVAMPVSTSTMPIDEWGYRAANKGLLNPVPPATVIRDMKQGDLEIVASRLSRYLGCEIGVEELPRTRAVLERIYDLMEESFRVKGRVEFDEYNKRIDEEHKDIVEWLGDVDIYRLCDAEVYSFIEDKYISSFDRSRLKKVLPDIKTRSKLFAEYVRDVGLRTPDSRGDDGSIIRRVFNKIYRALVRLISAEMLVLELFEDIRTGAFRQVSGGGEIRSEKGRGARGQVISGHDEQDDDSTQTIKL